LLESLVIDSVGAHAVSVDLGASDDSQSPEGEGVPPASRFAGLVIQGRREIERCGPRAPGRV